MNKLFVAGVVGLLAPTSAFAADPLSAVDWTRSYVGVQVGVVNMGSDWSGNDYWFGDIDASLGATGGVIGVFAGHDVQLDGFVLGAEADFNFLDVSDSQSWIDGPEGLTVTTSIKDLASLRGRIGVPWQNMLFYATAGVATGTVKASYIVDALSVTESGEHIFRLGVVAGAGVESQITDNMSVRLQGLYYNFGDTTFHSDLGTYSADAHAWVITAGLSWRW
jgi:outer membrane immunogenic protein